jgi:hypothetical protein
LNITQLRYSLADDGAVGRLFKKPHHRSYFNVSVDGFQGGKFTIFVQLAPVTTVNA